MTDNEIKAELEAVTAKLREIEKMPERCGLLYFYYDGNRVHPCVLGNSSLLAGVLEIAAKASDGFREVLDEVAERLDAES